MSQNQELVFELQNVLSQLKRSNNFKHSHSQLKGAEKHIMLLIAEMRSDTPVTISEIANKIGVTLAAVTHQINTLEKQGLIKRISNNDDRRVVFVEFTEEGKKQVAKVKKEFVEKIQILTEYLGESDTKDLIRLIKKISQFRGQENA